MKKLFIILAFVLQYISLYSQLQDRIWIFGRPYSGSTNATLYFGDLSNPVVNLPSGQPDHITASDGKEQWAVVTNPITGELIFYTDGKNVFDHQHVLVNALDLGASVSGAQPVAIAPVPKGDEDPNFSTYYIFSNETGAFPTTFNVGTIKYRYYDVMTGAFGTSQDLPGTYGTANVTEGMKIIPCDTSLSILWLVASLYPSSGNETKYVVYKINRNVVTYQGVYDMGPEKQSVPSGASTIVEITYTKANTSCGITNVGFAVQYTSAVFTCQFDNLSGRFLTGTARTLYTGITTAVPSVYNVEFSPNGRFLYYTIYASTGSSDNTLYQVDLNDAILTPTPVHTFSATYAGGLKLGPDSLIYHISDDGTNSNTLSVGRILQPDVKFIPGTTVFNQFYQEDFATYNDVIGVGFSETLIMPTSLPCGSLAISEDSGRSEQINLSVYPNPASDMVNLKISNKTNSCLTLKIYDIFGKLIRSELISRDKEQINTTSLNNGVYVLVVSTKDSFNVQKLIIQK